MWKLHRYYLRELGINSAITFSVLFAVVLVSLIARGIQKSEGGGLLDALKITLLYALDSCDHLLTISFLIATVLTFARAAQDRELVAIRAAGLSPRVPMTAAVLVGLLLSAGGSFANHYVIPEVRFRKFRVVAEVLQNVFTNLKLGSDRIQILDTGFVLTFRRNDGRDRLDCTIYCPSDKALSLDLPSPILKVDRVSIVKPHEGSEQLVIVLRGVRDPILGTTLTELPVTLDMHDIISRERRGDRDDELRSDQLLAEVLRETHPRPFEAIYTMFRRCCFSLMPALLAPIGYSIAELTRERGRVVAMLLALVPLGIFYFGDVLGARIMRATFEPLAAWLPVALLLVFGVPLCARQLFR